MTLLTDLGRNRQTARPRRSGPATTRHIGPVDIAGRLTSLLADEEKPETAYRNGRRRAGRTTQPARERVKFCPICLQWYARFEPFGLSRRRNALCPGCGSLERHRFLWLHLIRTMAMTFRWYSVLHIGPEPCLRDRLAAMPQLRYSAIDLYDPAAPERMDVEHLRFADRTFDLVLCSHVLEHVADDRRALSEMARVLRPGGRAVILVPLDLKRPHTFEDPSLRTPSERLAAFGHPYHRRICGADYGGRVEAAGFTVDAVPSTRLPAHHRRLYGINRNSLFECRRLRT